jgi:hypothetical protein
MEAVNPLHEALRQGSLPVGRRRRWRPFTRVTTGFTRLAPVEGQKTWNSVASIPSPPVVPCVRVFGPSLTFRLGTMASADSCRPIPHRLRCGSPPERAGRQASRDKHPFFRPAPAGFTPSRSWESRVSLSVASSPTAPGLLSGSVRQVVAVAPASFRPHLTVTPLPSLTGPDSLGRRGLSPPRTGTCPAYHQGPGLVARPSSSWSGKG